MADPNIFSFPEELLRKKRRPEQDFFATEILLDPGEPLEFSRFDYVAKWRGRARGPDFFCTPWLPPSIVRTSVPYSPPRVPMLRGAGRIPRKFGRVVG